MLDAGYSMLDGEGPGRITRFVIGKHNKCLPIWLSYAMLSLAQAVSDHTAAPREAQDAESPKSAISRMSHRTSHHQEMGTDTFLVGPEKQNQVPTEQS